MSGTRPTAARRWLVAVCARAWGRYQLRLAVGRAALGRPIPAIAWARRAVKSLQRTGIEDRPLATAFDLLATCYRSLGNLEAAEDSRRRHLAVLDAINPASTQWIQALIELGDLCRFRGDHANAETLLRQALDAADQPNLATDHLLKANALTALGIEYKDTARYDKAGRSYREALEVLTATDGPDHPTTATIWHNLAGLALARNHPDDAEPAAARAVAIREAELGPDHHLVAQDLAVLGAALLDLHCIDEAERAFNRALKIFQARHPADQYEVAVNLSNLAICQLRRGAHATAETLLRHGLTIKRAVFGDAHPEIARQLNNLAVAVGDQQRFDEAGELHRQALSIAQETLPPDHPLTEICRQNTHPDQPTPLAGAATS